MASELINPIAMAPFDFIDAAAQSYVFSWRNRAVLARLCLIPLLVNLAGYALIKFFGLDDNFLRQGLILMPAYFAEGWVMAKIIRMAILEEPLSGGKKAAKARQSGLLAGTLMYVLIKIFVSLLLVLADRSGFLDMAQPQADLPPPSLPMFLIAFAGVTFSVWAIRFYWFYIPAALNYALWPFVKRIRGFMISVHMIGTALLCFTPPLVLLLMIVTVLRSFMPDPSNPAAIFLYIAIVLQLIFSLFFMVTSTIAIALGLQQMVKGKDISA